MPNMSPARSKSHPRRFSLARGRCVFGACALALSLSLTGAGGAQAAGRVALVLAAEDYLNLNRSDVGVKRGLVIADYLRSRGFDVVVGANPTNASARGALGEFAVKAKGADIAIVLLIGHGISSAGQTFFLPRNAAIERATDLFSQGLAIANVLGIAAQAKVGGLCFLMTAPEFQTPIGSEDPRAQIGKNLPANVVVALSNSSRVPASRMDAVTKAVADNVAALLRDRAHASLRQLASACSAGQQGFLIGGVADIDLAVQAPIIASTETASTVFARPPDDVASGKAAAADLDVAKQAAPSPKSEDKKAATAAYSDREAGYKAEPESRTASGPDAKALFDHGVVLAENGDYASAIADFDRVVELDPGNLKALNNRCWLQAIRNELKKAAADCDSLLKTFSETLDSRAMIHLKLGEYALAIQDYDEALRLNSGYASALYGRGIAKKRTGASADAEKDFKAARAIDPKIEEAYVRYGLR